MVPGAKFSMSTSALSTRSEQRLATGARLQVQHDAALVGVQHDELVGLGRLVGAEAQWLTARWLDLYDVGAQLSQKQPAVWAVVNLAQLPGPGCRQTPMA